MGHQACPLPCPAIGPPRVATRGAQLHIVYVTETYPPEVNGVALTVERTVRHLREAGHRLTLVRPRQPGESPRDDADEWRTAGAPIPMYADLRVGWATAGQFMRRFARGRRPDLVHVATEGALGRAAVAAARRMGVPLTGDFRTNFHWYSRYYRLGWLEGVVWRYLRNFHNRCDATFVPTAAIAQGLAAEGLQRLEVVGRGVDAARFSPAHRSAELRRSWGVTDDRQRVLIHVGRLAAEKNVALALAAYDELHRHDPALRLVVVGDGPQRSTLQRLHPDVVFAGMQRGEALATHYASGDVFLFPSLSETFGNVTLEAMASGLAVVAFAQGVAAEAIRDGIDGYAAPVGDRFGFVDRIRRALVAPTLAPLRERAREVAQRRSWPSVLGDFAARLERIAAGETAASAPRIALPGEVNAGARPRATA